MAFAGPSVIGFNGGNGGISPYLEVSGWLHVFGIDDPGKLTVMNNDGQLDFWVDTTTDTTNVTGTFKINGSEIEPFDPTEPLILHGPGEMFAVQTAGATSVFTINTDTTTTSVLGLLNVTGNTTLTGSSAGQFEVVGTSVGTVFTISSVDGSTTIAGNTLINESNSLTKFSVQSVSSSTIFNVDTQTPAVTIGAPLILPGLTASGIVQTNSFSQLFASSTIATNTILTGTVVVSGANASSKFSVLDVSNNPIFSVQTTSTQTVAVAAELLMQGVFFQTGSNSFSTGSGSVTLNGSTTLNSGFLQTGSNTFGTGSGAVSLNGPVSVTGSTTFTVGTGLSTFNGSVILPGSNSFQMTSGTALFGGLINGTLKLGMTGLPETNKLYVQDVTGVNTLFNVNSSSFAVTTFKNTLDDGTGNASVFGTFQTGGLSTFTSGFTSSLDSLINGVNSTTKFQIKQSGGTTIFGVDTATPAVTFGATVTIPGLTASAIVQTNGSSGLFASNTLAENLTFTGSLSQTGGVTFSTGTGSVSLNGAVTFSSTLTQSGNNQVSLVGTLVLSGTNNTSKFSVVSATSVSALNVDTTTSTVTLAATTKITSMTASAMVQCNSSGALTASNTITYALSLGNNVSQTTGTMILNGTNSTSRFNVATSGGTTIFNVDTSTPSITFGAPLVISGLSANSLVQTNGSGALVTSNTISNALTITTSVTQTGSNTFSTGTGTVSLNGPVTITGSNSFSTGTGSVSLNGSTFVGASNTFGVNSGTSTFGGSIVMNTSTSGTPTVLTINNTNNSGTNGSTIVFNGYAISVAYQGTIQFTGQNIIIAGGIPSSVYIGNNSTGFCPQSNLGCGLGVSANKWSSLYTASITDIGTGVAFGNPAGINCANNATAFQVIRQSDGLSVFSVSTLAPATGQAIVNFGDFAVYNINNAGETSGVAQPPTRCLYYTVSVTNPAANTLIATITMGGTAARTWSTILDIRATMNCPASGGSTNVVTFPMNFAQNLAYCFSVTASANTGTLLLDIYTHSAWVSTSGTYKFNVWVLATA
jgi:hypothetical protein